MLKQMESIPIVAEYPAPWKLSGKGYILAVKLSADQLNCASALPEKLAKTRRGCIAYIMFVDYETSNAGPYQELLYIPGSFQFKEARRLSITKIYVSTWESVVNGRKNWGIPKEHCDFAVNYGDKIDRIELHAADGKVIAELAFQERLLQLPINTSWIPKRWRTLSQFWNGHEFTYTPEAKGHIRPAKLVFARFNSYCFPDITAGAVLGCLKVTNFEMTFPLSVVRPA